MRATRFFRPVGPISLRRIAELTGANLVRGDPDSTVAGAAPPEVAGKRDLTYVTAPTVPAGLGGMAAACLAEAGHAAAAPAETALLIADDPYEAYAVVLRALYPGAQHYGGSYQRREGGGSGPIDRIEGLVHPTAEREANVIVEPGAVIAEDAMIGRDTVIGVGAVVGVGVKIGRGSAIGPHASVEHALLGDRVVLRAGARIGQAGLGGAIDRPKRPAVPQLGRVIVQDGVIIGVNSCVDRGAFGDTVIGEGTVIGNLVQIGAGGAIGRCCLVADGAMIAAAATIPSFAVVGHEAAIGSDAIAVRRNLGENAAV